MLLLLVSFVRLHAVETPLLNDLFSDKERYYQNPPESSCWYYIGGIYSFAHLNTDPSQGNSGQLRMISTGGDYSTAMALAYFTAAGAPQNLAAGESLTLEFKVRLDRLIDADSNLRFALFNSKGTQPTGDVQGYGYDNLYNNTHDGYQVALNTGAAAGALRIYERNNQGGGSPFSLNAGAIRATNSAAASTTISPPPSASAWTTSPSPPARPSQNSKRGAKRTLAKRMPPAAPLTWPTPMVMASSISWNTP